MGRGDLGVFLRLGKLGVVQGATARKGGIAMKVVLPNSCIPIEHDDPLFFLAGPVGGGGDWQVDCCALIKSMCPQCYVAIPNRYPLEHPLMADVVTAGNISFGRQLIWERYYLDMAAKRGCLLFWCPCESKEFPRSDGEPYATDTRGEIGEWRGHLMHDQSLRVVIGADPMFPGVERIRANFEQGLRLDFPFHTTLEDVVRAAVQRVAA